MTYVTERALVAWIALLGACQAERDAAAGLDADTITAGDATDTRDGRDDALGDSAGDGSVDTGEGDTARDSGPGGGDAEDAHEVDLEDSHADVDVGDEVDTSAPESDAEVCAPVPGTWSRRMPTVGGVVVFDELAPTADGGLAWIELHSLMAVSVDLSGWRLAGDVAFTFPEGTLVPAGGRVLVAADPARLTDADIAGALGPWEGALGPGAHLELRNNTGRLMDLVAADDGAPWPAPAPGRTLVKTHPEASSVAFESWRSSASEGGTPGGGEASDHAPRVLVVPDARWRFAVAATMPNDWPTPAASAWAEGAAPLSDGGGAARAELAITADNHFAVYLGAADGADLRLVGRDTHGDWTSVERFDLEADADDHLFVAAWEGPGDSGSPQMLIAEVARADGTRLGTAPETFDATLGPPQANPGDGLADPSPSPDALAEVVAAADADGFFEAPWASAPSSSGPWGPALGGAFTTAGFIWLDTFDGASATNQEETYALFRSREPVAAPTGTVLTPSDDVTWLTHRFSFDGDPRRVRLALTLVAADGAAVWLNGVELHREGLPEGPLTAATPALAPVVDPAPTRVERSAEALVVGDNTLAIQVHRAQGGAGLRFWASLEALPLASSDAPSGDVVLNELMYHPVAAPGGPEPSDWIELVNRGPAPVDLGGWRLVDGVEHTLAPGTVLAPGAFLVLASDPAAFASDHPDVPVAGDLRGGLAASGERVALIDACGRVSDEVRYSDGGRWPERADGGGSSLERVDARADGRSPESWAASAESDRAGWREVRYRGVAAPSAVGPDGQWQELVIGLLDDGEVLLDDVHVIEDPDGARRELVRNPGFDGDSMAHWRALGTHAESRVTRDPDAPNNSVLRLVATGPTEHMHNQLVTTFADGRAITNGQTYEISLRARWVGGSDQLSTRLYFNRLARTTRLGRPGAGGTPGRENGRRVANAGPTFEGLAHAPVVPRADESVMVSVAASDPDGVEALTLWSRVDDGPATATPMAPAGDGRWTASLPGEALGAVVQLWVEGVDGLGARATHPALGPASRALYRVDAPRTPSSPGGALHGLRIAMTPGDDAAFHDPTQVMSNASTRATVVYGEREVFYDVGVRAKGSERARTQPARLGWSIRFDPDRPLRGAFATVSVDRSEGVITGVREILMDLVMAHAGSPSAEYNDLAWVVAPRAEHTGPALLQTARFGDDMLDAQFPDGGEGQLYEYELVYYPLTTLDGTPEGLKLPEPDGVLGVPLGDLGDDPERYRWSFLKKNNRAADDFSGLIAMLKTWSLDGAGFADAIGRVVDVDAWLRAFAFMALSGAIDHYGSGAQHNAQIYLRPDDGRALLFPHDLDFYPGDPKSPVIQSGDLARLLTLPGARRRFYAELHDILATTYNDAYLAPWRDELTRLVPGQPFASHHDFMVERAAWVRSGASDAVERVFPRVAFAITTNGGADLSVPAGVVVLEGTGWLDVEAIRWDGAPVALVFTDDTRWRVSRVMPLGSYTVRLEARDRQGAVVGVDSIGLEVTP